jgi:hypothetical protein
MRGHPVLGVIAGFFFGLFLAVTLVLAGVLPLNSVLVTLMPFLGIAYGLVLARFAPFGRKRSAGQV